jgi:uncharacterized protein (DUF433 family)
MMDRSIIIGLSSTVKDGGDMITQELRQQILSLSSDEQDEIVQLIQAKTNLWAGITKTPGVVGGDACVRNMRIPVWSLVEYRQMGANDDKIIEAYPQLTAADLDNAWAYAEAFPTEIAEAIAANEEA